MQPARVVRRWYLQVIWFLSVVPTGMVMTPALVRLAARLGVVLFCLAAAGCFVPGGGWTMRGGLDFRRRHKPSAFVELVDTRWDEFNRIAEMNISDGMADSNVVVAPVNPPGTGPAIGNPTAVPYPSGAGSTDSGQNPEPHPLPGMPEEPEPPPPGAGPTARRLPSAGPRYLPSSNEDTRARRPGAPGNDIDDDVLEPDEDDDDADINLSSYSRSSGRRTGTAWRRSNYAPATATQRPPLRPAASRLFSRPQ